MSSRSRAAAYAALAAVCVFWGTTYLGIRMALESFPPAVLMSLRYFLSGSILLLIAWLGGAHLPRGRELWTTSLSGALTIGVGTGALAFAEQWIPSGLASLIINMSPFWFVIFEALLPRGTALHAPTIFGMVVGLAGTALLFLPGAGLKALGPGLLPGFFVLQAGMIGWCLGSIYQKRQVTRAHPIITGAVQQVAASLAFLPLAFLVPHPPIVLKARAVWAVAYLVVFGSIVGYSAYAYAMAKLPVAIVSVYSYVNSTVAVGLGWLFYREPFGPRELIAMLVIFSGVAIVKWQTAKVEKQTQSRLSVEPA
jgi:drug/metabolite transporter (DMT)-like permease